MDLSIYIYRIPIHHYTEIPGWSVESLGVFDFSPAWSGTEGTHDAVRHEIHHEAKAQDAQQKTYEAHEQSQGACPTQALFIG